MEQPTSGQNVGEPTPHPASDAMGTEPVSRASTSPMPAAQQRTWDDTMSQLDVYAERARVALPLAPAGLLDGYMKWAPWVAIVFGVLWVLVSIVAVMGSTIFGPLLVMLGESGTGFTFFVGSVISLVSAVLEVMGGWLMLQRKATGWWLLALGLVVSLLSSLVHVALPTLIVLLLISYVHLQVKPNYR